MTGDNACYGYVNTNELFLKVVASKRQAKFLKTICEVVSFYYICELYPRIFFVVVAKFAKIACDMSLYRIEKNLIIYFAEGFQYFSHFKFTTLLTSSYLLFGAVSF